MKKNIKNYRENIYNAVFIHWDLRTIHFGSPLLAEPLNKHIYVCFVYELYLIYKKVYTQISVIAIKKHGALFEIWNHELSLTLPIPMQDP